MSENNLIFLIIPLFIVCFGLLWTLIVVAISRLGGWAALAGQYPAPGPATGRTFSMRSAKFGLFSSYRNCLTVSLSLSGIHMQPMIVFRVGHKPILIPWAAVEGVSRQNFFFTSALKLRVKDRETGTTRNITFYGNELIEALEVHAETYKIPRD